MKKIPRQENGGQIVTTSKVDGFQRVTSETTQLIMGFLTMSERFALMQTQQTLMKEPLATVYTSYCGKCDDCVTTKCPHLCKQKDTSQHTSFWQALVKYSAGLQELRLAGCNGFTDDVLKIKEAKATLVNLRVLELTRCTSLGDEGLALLAKLCCNLQELRFRDMAVDSAALKIFVEQNQQSLRVIDLLGCHTVDGDDVSTIAKCKNLRDLSLQGCHNVDNKTIIHVVEHCTDLHRINLRYCHKVDDKVVAAIALNLPKLKDLNLRYCCKISDKGVNAICDALPNLETLNLSQCMRITDAAIFRIVGFLTCLKELRLWGCTKLTSAAVYAISSGPPTLTLVDIRSRDKFEAVIGGPTALKFLIQTYRSTLVKWEQAGQVGVFKRPLICALAA